MCRRALFLDRDGVINADYGFVGTIDRFEFCPGIFPFLRSVQDRGYRLVIVTNQSGVAQGKFSREQYETLTAYMLDALSKEGITIDLILACFAHPNSIDPSLRYESSRRKPKPGMILEALETLNLDPSQSAMLGDSQRDVEAALAAGLKTCLWLKAENPVVLDGVHNITSFDEALSYL